MENPIADAMTWVSRLVSGLVVEWANKPGTSRVEQIVAAVVEIPDIEYDKCWCCGWDKGGPRSLPMICSTCEAECGKRGFVDPMEDLDLLWYLFYHTHRAEANIARVSECASVYHLATDYTAGRIE